MAKELFLGIDVGTSGVKALLVDTDGNVVDQTTEEYPLLTPKPLWAEQNPEDWWSATIKTCRTISGRSRSKGDISGLGLTGQMHGSVFLDKDDRVIRPAILWCDQRTGEEVKEIEERIGRERIIRITGNPVFTGFTAPKIIWLRKNEPASYRKIAKLLLPKDYIRYKLTGVFASEVTDNSGTSLFDVTERKWSQEVLDILQIKKDWLAAVFESPEVIGKITPEAARLTDLPENIPVSAGAGDQAASGCGNGVVSEGIISVTLGTSGVVFAFSDQVRKDPAGRIHAMCHAVPDTWHLMGCTLSAGGSLRWFRDNFCLSEISRAKKEGKDPYELMTEEAGKVPAGSEGMIFLPYLTGERTPHANPLARATFFGATSRHTRAYFIRAVLEGITFALKDTVEIMKELNLPIKEVRISGGGARSDLWCQIVADIFEKEVVRTENPDTTAFGSAILATVAGRFYQSVPEACQKMVRTKERFQPDQEKNKVLRQSYQVFRKLYPVLKPYFDAVAGIGI
ncbi:MAG: xylulokinase [Candidatus Omnitrophota bacterium]